MSLINTENCNQKQEEKNKNEKRDANYRGKDISWVRKMTRAGYPSWYSRETRRPIRGAIALKQIVMPGLRLQTNHSFCFYSINILIWVELAP